MTILGWPQTQFQKKNHLAFIEGQHTSWFPTDQRSFLVDAARCRPPRSYPETGLRKASGHVYWASCRNPEVVRSRHHGISNEESDWGRLPLISPNSVSGFRFADHPPGTRLLASQNLVPRSRRANLRETGYATAEIVATHGGNLILRRRSWKSGSVLTKSQSHATAR